MGWIILDRLRRAQRLAHATGELAVLVFGQGWMLLAWAWARRNKEWT